MEKQLSQKSTKFIDDLKLYLFTSGKKDVEIEEIVHELEDHLYDAELNGKTIEQIIGSSPKDYMQSISKEIKTDYKGWAKYIPMIIVASMSFIVFRDLLSGTLRYGILSIIGSIIYSLLYFAGVMTAFRYIASRQVSRKKEMFILLLPTVLSTLFISGIFLVDLLDPSPAVHFGIIGSSIIGILFLGFNIFFSIWAKTAILPVTLLALILPEAALAQSSFGEITQIIFSMITTYIIIGIYLYMILRREKANTQ